MSTAAVPISRRLAAEALGTGLLLAAVVGSGIMGERLSPGAPAVGVNDKASSSEVTVAAEPLSV